MESENYVHPHKDNVHRVTTHGYVVHFVMFLVGVSLDLFFHPSFFSGRAMQPLGVFLLVSSSIAILWAQWTSGNLHKEEIKTESFCRGPFCYTRCPTYWGLFFLMLGFGIIANAFFVFLTTLVSFLVARFVFLRKEEAILEKKYGAHYTEYKKLVKF